MKNSYDVIILATKKNIEMLKIMVPYCITNLQCKNVIVIANKRDFEAIKNVTNIVVYDEDEVLDGLSYENLDGIIKGITSEKVRVGWYLQQFLKLAWAYKCDDEKYIVIDADTIPLNPIFFEDAEGKDLFTEKVEYNKPYFDTIDTLFQKRIRKQISGSFVAEHMLFRKSYVIEMLDEIMKNEAISGDSFYEKIIHSIEPNNLPASGFSEFETYGNYVFTYHENEVRLRKLRTQREAVYLIGSRPRTKVLSWAARDYDLISIEVNDYKNTLFTILSRCELFRKYVKMREIAKYRSKLRSLYRKLTGKKDFKYEENI